MATKPTPRIPVWASGGVTTDPGAGKESTGWVVDERPPANWWNWVWNAMGQWLTWAETSIDDLEAKPTIQCAATITTGPSPGIAYNAGGVSGIVLGDADEVDVNLSKTFASTSEMICFATRRTVAAGTPDHVFAVEPKTTSQVTVRSRVVTTGSIQNLQATNLDIGIMVIGTLA